MIVVHQMDATCVRNIIFNPFLNIQCTRIYTHSSVLNEIFKLFSVQHVYGSLSCISLYLRPVENIWSIETRISHANESCRLNTFDDPHTIKQQHIARFVYISNVQCTHITRSKITALLAHLNAMDITMWR